MEDVKISGLATYHKCMRDLVEFPSFVLKVASWFSSFGGLFLKRHINEECKAFAKDIEEKFKAN